MLSRLGSIDRRYQELLELSKLRKQRLEDAAALYQLFNEADGTEQWIAEKVRILYQVDNCTDVTAVFKLRDFYKY